MPWGTDNAMFRLGDDKVVRLPRIGWAVGQVEKDLEWLPILAPQLPVGIPELLAAGTPSVEYLWVWGIYRWLEGEPLTADRLHEARHAESDLARFLIALRRIDTTGGPPASSRGVPLATRDEAVRHSIAALGERVDACSATASWVAALGAPEWHEAPTWLHGDLTPGNLLLVDGRLSAIVDVERCS